DATGMHQLYENAPAVGVHGVGDFAPAARLLLIEAAGNARITEPVRRRRRTLGNDQAGTGPQAVILRHHVVRNVAERATTGHRRHDNAVLQRDRTELELTKKFLVFHYESPISPETAHGP